MAGMRGFYHHLPKAELHLHLEGAVEPATLKEMAPELSLEQIREHYEFEDFAGFLRSYAWVARHLRGPYQYALATRRLLERLERDNVRYLELNLSAGVMLRLGLDFAAIYGAVVREAAASPIQVAFILDAVRQFGAREALRVAELAAERAGEGVVGFGVGGDEARGPIEWFSDAFRLARSRGLHLTPHAGETMGPESVWGAIRMGAERIGHGIRAVEDPELLRALARESIALEICLTSNVATGLVPSVAAHPLRRIFDAGVPVVLNTDDPAMFRTTLPGEFEVAERELGFTRPELVEVARNGFRFGFQAARS